MEINGFCELIQIYVIFHILGSFFIKCLTHKILFIFFNIDPFMIHQKQGKNLKQNMHPCYWVYSILLRKMTGLIRKKKKQKLIGSINI